MCGKLKKICYQFVTSDQIHAPACLTQGWNRITHKVSASSNSGGMVSTGAITPEPKI